MLTVRPTRPDARCVQAEATIGPDGASNQPCRHYLMNDIFRGWRPRPIPEATLATMPKAGKPTEPPAAQHPYTLPAAMTGRASPAKAALGDKPVYAYISSLPEPQRSIAEAVDALAARTLPNLQRSVKWGMAWYGVGDGWCFSCGGFAGHVKLTFGHGTGLTPVPPVTPIGMGRESRGVDLASLDDIDDRQLASWMQQATATPGFGGRKR